MVLIKFHVEECLLQKKTLVKKKKLVSKVVSGYCEILENVFTIRLYSGKGWGVLNDFYDF